jgi:N-dimethylarginine dimethylaminohydrolase
MTEDHNSHYDYNQAIKMFTADPDSRFEDGDQLAQYWGGVWGIDNDVGQIRSVLVHRPGPEMALVDPAKRIPEIAAFGDREKNWYYQSDTMPDIALMQSQHDAMVAAMQAAGITVHQVDNPGNHRLKRSYTRDPLIMVKGGAIICRMGSLVRRGEELAIARTLLNLGIPILRTITGHGTMEGGSFAWINDKTCAIGAGVRVNREGAEQVGEVLRRQGVELLLVELPGYDLHLDFSLVMIDRDLALVNPMGLPYLFMQELKSRGVTLIEIEPADNPMIINSLALAPGKLLMPEGAGNRTLDALARHGVSWTTIPFAAMHKNGGGIHCSTTPLRRDPL